jgi:hypothetical protein
MPMLRYVNATVKRVVDPEKIKKIVVCHDSGTVKDEPDEDESENDERDNDETSRKVSKKPD